MAISGGASIIGFATVQIVASAGIAWKRGRTISDLQKSKKLGSRKGPFATGVVFSVLNPFFLVWWFTAGLKLASDSVAFGPVAGPALLFGAHIWMDYAWLAATAYLASKGGSVLKSKYYRILVLGLSGILLYYGVQFLVNGLAVIVIKKGRERK